MHPWRLLNLLSVIAVLVLALAIWNRPAQAPAVEPAPVEEEQVPLIAEVPDLIRVDAPAPGALITSPVTIRGAARGTWFFEASFPVALTNWDGLIIAQGVAQAQGDWMTEDYVPFEVTLTFDLPETYPQGTLILQKDNPSGLPEFDNALELPVRYW